MFRGLKIALQRQKKLIIIFLLTILIPSVTLSIFGFIALRNERFKLEKDFRKDQLQILQTFKEKVNQSITELENELQYIVLTPAFLGNDYDKIVQLVEDQIYRNHLADQFFMLLDGEEPSFPPFQSAGNKFISVNSPDFTIQQKNRLQLAEKYEFSQHDYQAAISRIEEVLKETQDKDLRGQLMNLIARNQMKNKNFSDAIISYSKIINYFPESVTSLRTPLPVIIRLQLVECYTQLGKNYEALKEVMTAYDAIIRNYNSLTENQLSAYVNLVSEKFNKLTKDDQTTGFNATDYIKKFEELNKQYQELKDKWNVVNNLKEQCIPKIFQEGVQADNNSDNILRYSERIGSEDFLILAIIIPGKTKSDPKGIAGIKINNAFLKDSLFSSILINIPQMKASGLIIADAGGDIISGDTVFYNKPTNIISYFDKNFPPWRIEIQGEPARPLMFTGFIKSFYLWSIIAMIVILVFGIVITGRIIGHEKEILQLKSDFVSSVSHEFKTPITSIKVLTERLLEGNVKDQKRVREYYSVISRDAENLRRLVENFLDFSKIEEGKKEYDFEETDLSSWLQQTVNDFSEKIQPGRILFQPGNEQHLTAKIDRPSMKLVIDNLLDNAVKFSAHDSEVIVTLEKQEKSLLISVKDKGIGIPKDEHTRIFDKFYRGKDSASHSATGTGLGLNLVKRIVTAHAGEIGVESEPGKGSVFRVTIPCY